MKTNVSAMDANILKNASEVCCACCERFGFVKFDITCIKWNRGEVGNAA